MPPFAANNIYVIGVEGTGLSNLTVGLDAHAWGARWSLDADRIAFTASWDIYVMDADGGQLQNLTGSEGQEREPAWSPDGLQLAWIRGMSEERDVIVYDFETRRSVLVSTGAYVGVTTGGYSRVTPVVAWRPSP